MRKREGKKKRKNDKIRKEREGQRNKGIKKDRKRERI
jgi:hypothetical protein